MNKFFKVTKRGFTLVELLIVIIIIAVLAGIVLVAINPAEQRYRAMLTTMKENVASTCSAQAVCAVDNNVSACNTFGTTAVDISNPYSSNAVASGPTTYTPATGAITTFTCTTATAPCMGFMAATPYAVAAQLTVDTNTFQMTCHNESTTANRGKVMCSVSGAGTRTCASMKVV